ncbi:hypothetical protein [Microvirga subterranea]|nr:hypothetical protein [Microvirga subterranea]
MLREEASGRTWDLAYYDRLETAMIGHGDASLATLAGIRQKQPATELF